MAFKFEKLEVWKRAVNFASTVHELTRLFPKGELYILTPQIKRASDSISLNIAEGSTGQSDKEFVKFLSYAQRSAIEVVTCLYLAKGRELILEDVFDTHYLEASILIRQIQALKRSVQNNSSNT